jgi:methyl-accepting chemotaxis protein
MQEAQAQIFARNALPDQIEAVESALKGPVVDEVARMRAVGTAAPFDAAAVHKVSGTQWFDAATRNIDLLKTIEDRLAGDFLRVARGASDQARWGFWSVVLIFLAMLAITLGLAIVIAVSNTRPIANLVKTSELAKGRADIDVAGTERKDEIGEMARTVVVFGNVAVEKARLEVRAAQQREQVDEQGGTPPERGSSGEGRAGAGARRRGAGCGFGQAGGRRPHGPSERRLHPRLSADQGRLQPHDRGVAGDHRADCRIDQRGRQYGGGNLHRHRGPVAAHRGAGREPRADFGLDGADLRDRPAQRSAQAAEDINNLIAHSSGRVQEGVELVNRAGSSLGEIVESSKRVADIVADVANASAEQATGLDQINKALTQMDEVTQQNSALVEENAATAKTLENQSGAVRERLALFRYAAGTACERGARSAA